MGNGRNGGATTPLTARQSHALVAELRGLLSRAIAPPRELLPDKSPHLAATGVPEASFYHEGFEGTKG